MKALGLDEIKKVLEDVSIDNYILTHITSEEDAKKIFESNFKYNLGTGLNGTFSLSGRDHALAQIENILNGNSPHRNLSGMFILKIPKEKIGEHGQAFKVSAEVIEDFLIDNYESMNEGIIPEEFNLGYLDKDTLFYKN